TNRITTPIHAFDVRRAGGAGAAAGDSATGGASGASQATGAGGAGSAVTVVVVVSVMGCSSAGVRHPADPTLSQRRPTPGGFPRELVMVCRMLMSAARFNCIQPGLEPTEMAARYQAFVEMAGYAEANGFSMITL